MMIPLKSGFTIQSKLIIGAGLIVLASLGIEAGISHFEEKGRQLERATWLQKQVDWNKAKAKLIADNEAKNKQVLADNEAKRRKTSALHEQEITKVRGDLDRARRDIAGRGGLRIPAPACPNTGAAGPGAETPGTSGRDEAGPITIALPPGTEDSIWSIVNEAESIASQLRACQGWIRLNGFYGETSHDEPNKLAADPLQ